MGNHKTALVLSAGGMFGAYQAGAYKTIRALIKPDIVVGASVGALNGWPIASGCTPDDLIERWLDPTVANTLRLFPNAGWRNGWLDPAPLRAQAESIFTAYTPRLPLGVVIVEFPRFTRRLIQFPDIRVDHLVASCSMPVFLPMVKVDGRRCLDGGLFEKLPVWAAIEMGATRIIAVDSLPNVGRWWIQAGASVARVFAPRRRLPANIDLTVISPSEWLGSANDAVFWKRENVVRWVELGARDAAATLDAAADRAA